MSASTQNQALSALLFLYREVLDWDLPWLDGVVRAKRPERLPVVPTRDEVRAVIERLHGVPRLMGLLVYGADLPLLETRRRDAGSARRRTATRCCSVARPTGLQTRTNNRSCLSGLRQEARGRRRPIA